MKAAVPLLCFLSCVLVAGCHLGEALKDAKTPDLNGDTPLALAIRAVPRAIAGDPTSMVSLLQFGIGFLTTAFVGHKVATKRSAKKKAIATAPVVEGVGGAR